MAALKLLDGSKVPKKSEKGEPTPKRFVIPKEWRDEQDRRKAAEYIIEMIDATQTDETVVTNMANYQFAQNVFDDKEVPGKIDFGEDVIPYNSSMLRRQVKGAVRLVVSALNGADPYFIFKGGKGGDVRSARERDTQLILESDDYKFKIRETARIAAIWGRGFFRIAWSSRKAGEVWGNPETIKDPELEFAGPARETILPGDFVFYPLSQVYLTDGRMIGHRFDEPMYEIWAKQDAGEYIAREELDAQTYKGTTKVETDKQTLTVDAEHDQNTLAVNEEDYSPDIYHVIVRLWPGMDRTLPMVAYRVYLLRGQQELLAISRYEHSTLEYFGPGFEFDPAAFLPTQSIATSVMEEQTKLNDITTTRMLAGVGATRPTVVATGYVPDQTSAPIQVGTLTVLPNGASITAVGTTTPPSRDMMFLSNEARKDAEGVSGFSDSAAGQQANVRQTATAENIQAHGVSEEGEEKRENFMAEELRAVRFIQMLCSIPENYAQLKDFHGDALETTSAEDWKQKFTIVTNGQGTGNNPTATVQKIETLLEIKDRIQIPWLDEVQAGAPNPGIALSRESTFKTALQNLDLPYSSDQILTDTSDIQPPGIPNGQPPGQQAPPGLGLGTPNGQPMDANQAPGAGAGIPPELLAAIAGGPGGVPGGMAPSPQGDGSEQLMQLILALAGGSGQGLPLAG